MNANYIPLIASLVEALVNIFIKRRKVRDLVLPLIEKAAADGTLPDNKARRDWVLSVMTNEYGLSESTARLLIEAGVALYKKLADKKAKVADKAAAKAERAAKKKAPPA